MADVLREWVRRALGSVGRGRTDADLEAELRMHVELAAEDEMHRGAAVQHAERAARVRSGGVSQAIERMRDQRGLPWIDEARRDLMYGVRTLRRTPVFTLVTLLTLALGIGANAAVYQIFDAIRLRPLPVKDPHELVIVQLADLTRWTGRRTTSHPALTNPLWERFRDRQDVFSGVLAWSNGEVWLDQDLGAGVARALFVSGAFFEVLGVSPLRGRVLTPADDRAGCGVPGAVVSHRFWQARLGGDERVVGRTIGINGHRIDVVGVMPPEFVGVEVGRAFDVAVPICAHGVLGRERGRLADGTIWWLTVMGRLAPGTTRAQANARLGTISPALFHATVPRHVSTDDAENYLALRLLAVPGATGVTALRARYGDPLGILLVTTALVLLAAVANLASLILARASAREREFAVRLALGASRGRLIRQLMVESSLLAVGGALAGLTLAGLLSRVLIASLGPGTVLEPRVDARLAALTMLTALLTCLALGLTPAWRSARAGAADTMRVHARNVSGSARASRTRAVLLVVQLAISMVLVVGALVFAATLRNLLGVDPGFDPESVVVARVDFGSRSLAPEERLALQRDLLERIRNAPRVSAAAEVRHVPMGGTGSSMNVWRDDAAPATKVAVRQNAISEGYLDAMGIALNAGRDFTAGDFAAASRVAIVNPTFARRLGLRGNPVGQRFRSEGPSSSPHVVYEIVGLVRDTKYFNLREEFLPIAFVPFDARSDPRPFTDVMIRSPAPPELLAADLRPVVARVSPQARMAIRSYEGQLHDGLHRERLMAALSVFFGAVAGLIAAIGLYGVLSYHIARRTNEIGVRIALGARRSSILVMVLWQSGRLVASGLALGALVTLALANSVRSLVFGVNPDDVGPIVMAGVVLTTVAVVASWIPARRAARLEAVAALRVE